MNLFTAGEHVATLHEPSGAGILIAPSYGPGDHLGGHSDDWSNIMRVLHSNGWGPLCDDGGLPIKLAHAEDCGIVYALQAGDSYERASDADYDSALLSLLATAGI